MCKVCIYTERVPVADHVSSLIMHIKAGLEDEIMTTGNPYDTKKENIPDGHWIQQFLPKPIVWDDSEIGPIRIEASQFGEMIERAIISQGFKILPKRNEAVMRRLKKGLARDIYKTLVEPYQDLFSVTGGLQQNVYAGLIAAPYQ